MISLSGSELDLNAARVRFDDGGTYTLVEREVELLRYLAQNACRDGACFVLFLPAA